MNDKDIRMQLHHAMDARLSGMTGDPQLAQRIISAERSSRVKRKISVGVVIAIVLFILTLGALAATLLWENYVDGLVQKEKRIGTYDEWEPTEKETLIKDLVDMNYIKESEETEKLFARATTENEKNQLADQIMLAFLSQDSHLRMFIKDGGMPINWKSITYAILGYQDTWPSEKRVWLQELEKESGEYEPDYSLAYLQKEDISEEEAVSIAKRVIIQAFGMPMDELDGARPLADLYVTDERPGYRRWYVEFKLFDDDDAFEDRIYWTFLDSQGNLIADTDRETDFIEQFAARAIIGSEGELPSILQTYCEFAENEGSYLVRDWSLEAKAAYSSKVRKNVLDALSGGNLSLLTNPNSRFRVPNQEVISSTFFAYGLPGEEDIDENEAVEKARKILEAEYGVSAETLVREWSYYSYFDVTDQNKPLWRFLYFPDSFEGLSYVPVYRIELDSHTGETTSLHTYEWNDLILEKAYNTKWY